MSSYSSTDILINISPYLMFVQQTLSTCWVLKLSGELLLFVADDVVTQYQFISY
jgi:hypothetical protein